jgi:hypothetical protein
MVNGQLYGGNAQQYQVGLKAATDLSATMGQINQNLSLLDNQSAELDKFVSGGLSEMGASDIGIINQGLALVGAKPIKSAAEIAGAIQTMYKQSLMLAGQTAAADGNPTDASRMTALAQNPNPDLTTPANRELIAMSRGILQGQVIKNGLMQDMIKNPQKYGGAFNVTDFNTYWAKHYDPNVMTLYAQSQVPEKDAKPITSGSAKGQLPTPAYDYYQSIKTQDPKIDQKITDMEKLGWLGWAR